MRAQNLSTHPAVGVSRRRTRATRGSPRRRCALATLNKVGYRFWQTYIRAWVRCRATVEPSWQRRADGGDVPLESAALGARSRTSPQAHPRLPGDVQTAGSCRATTTRRCRSQASISSPRRSTTSSRAASSPRTARCTNWICSCWPPGSMPAPTSARWRSSARTASRSTRPGKTGPHAYRSVAVPGFPNLFMLMGPHSPIGNQSLVIIAEDQADYAMWWINQIRDGMSSPRRPPKRPPRTTTRA